MSEEEIIEEEEKGTMKQLMGIMVAVGIILIYIGLMQGNGKIPEGFLVAVAGSILLGSAGIMRAIGELQDAIVEKL